MKKNINLFYWENKIFLEKELSKWLKRFEEKYTDFNISRIHKDNFDKENIISEILTPPFLSEFRLIVIEDIFWNTEETENNNVQEKIINSIENIPDNNIIIFIWNKIDPKNKLFKKLLDVWQIKEFKNLSENELKIYIREKLLEIDNSAIEKLIRYKWGNLDKIDHEIDKLQLFKNHERVKTEDIEKYISPEIEVSIFELLDNLYSANYNEAILKFRIMMEQNKSEAIFASILTNIRKFIYVNLLHNVWLDNNQIAEYLKIRWMYFIQKSIANKARFDNIKKIYLDLIRIDLLLKSWKLIWEWENNFALSFEKMILDLKKKKYK